MLGVFGIYTGLKGRLQGNHSQLAEEATLANDQVVSTFLHALGIIRGAASSCSTVLSWPQLCGCPRD